MGETRKYADLEARYKDASGKKASAEQVLQRLQKDVEGMTKIVIAMIDQMRRSKNRLAQIALKPDHMNSVEYIDMMIQAEKSEGRVGFMDRVKELQFLRSKVETMQQPMKEYKEDPDVKGALESMQKGQGGAGCVIC